MKRFFAGAAALVFGLTGCGGTAGTPAASTTGGATPSPTAATASPSPTPSPTIPSLWPSKVVAAMPAAMRKKYEARMATTDEDEKQYFYFADTLEELPLNICVALAVNGDDSYSTDGLQLPPEGTLTMTRVADYVQSSGSDFEVYANHEVINPMDYVHHLAMDDDSLVQLTIRGFCPEMAATWTKLRPEVREAVQEEAARNAELAAAEYDRTHPVSRFADGAYTVGTRPGMILPGRYRLKGAVVNCYWERSTKNGATIANDFVTNAPSGISVTVRTGEGFTSEGCAEGRRWERVS
ncbi:hypothetical protein [Micromonospora chersina]|uniref:hypothetical protein n=1 Tax=Micromonospora chersina TaxID=47854 RepID=UPI00370F8C1A